MHIPLVNRLPHDMKLVEVHLVHTVTARKVYELQSCGSPYIDGWHFNHIVEPAQSLKK